MDAAALLPLASAAADAADGPPASARGASLALPRPAEVSGAASAPSAAAGVLPAGMKRTPPQRQQQQQLSTLEQRKVRNRAAAHESRAKKRRYVTELEGTVARLTRDNEGLAAHLRVAELQNAVLAGKCDALAAQLKALTDALGPVQPPAAVRRWAPPPPAPGPARACGMFDGETNDAEAPMLCLPDAGAAAVEVDQLLETRWFCDGTTLVGKHDGGRGPAGIDLGEPAAFDRHDGPTPPGGVLRQQRMKSEPVTFVLTGHRYDGFAALRVRPTETNNHLSTRLTRSPRFLAGHSDVPAADVDPVLPAAAGVTEALVNQVSSDDTAAILFPDFIDVPFHAPQLVLPGTAFS
ncbi:MAG: hypothetical protein BJ554DRAFT_1552, partial [Olpidium bornovanus]